jgi:WD40 repeat protein
VAQIGRQVASAVAHAHAHGILHRDIKPANILLDTGGNAWVSDFGLAKSDEEDLTRTGDLVGTLRYMAPERFRGEGDVRADVYALGLTVYELLVLRPAFDSADRLALSEQIKSVEPARPRTIDPRIPRDLETIVLKAIEKDPRQRYATAEAMAEDLRRFLEDEPILARRASATERSLRWARRHPAVAASAALLAAVLLGATVVSTVIAGRMAALAEVNRRAAWRERLAKESAFTARQRAEAQRAEAQRQRERAESERAEAQRQRERAEQQAYNARIGQVDAALRLEDIPTARSLLDQCRPGPGEVDRRGWEWAYLDQWCNPELRTIALPPNVDSSNCVAVSPDGRLLAVGGGAPFTRDSGAVPPISAYLVSLPDGRVRHKLTGHKRLVHAVLFRPDGKRLATIGEEGVIRVWDTASGQELRVINPGVAFFQRNGVPPSPILSWSPDGRQLASVSGDGLIRIWDPETGTETGRIAQDAYAIAWAPQGNRIALLGRAGLEVRPWDAREARLGEPVLECPGEFYALAWSLDDRRLATVSYETDTPSGWKLTLWDATTRERVFQTGQVSQVFTLAFSPDGSRVTTGGRDGVVRVFDASDGRVRAALFTLYRNVTGLAFSRDGRRLYGSGWGLRGEVKVFDPAREPRVRGIATWLEQDAALTFDREGLRIVEASWLADGAVASANPFDGTVLTERLLPVTNSRTWPRGDFAFSPDARRVAAPMRGDPSVVGVWDVALNHRVAALRGSRGPVSAVAFGPDGALVATAAYARPSDSPLVTLWDVASGRPTRSFTARPGWVRTVAFSGDGRRIAAGGSRGTGSVTGWITAWDAGTGAVLGHVDRGGSVQSVAFHPDGTHLAAADIGHKQLHLWDLATGTVTSHPGPDAVSCVAFTPDGTRLAALGYDGNVHLADARTGEVVLVLRGAAPPPGSFGFTPRLAFSPDGSRIVGDTAHFLLNLWDLGPRSGLSAEPKAGDVAGWLRRSRALAEQGDAAGAEAAAARARGIPAGDASPWIEHAVWLQRGGETSHARDALDRAIQALPDDPGRWVDLGRQLGRLGWTEGADVVWAKARSVLERRLALDPGDETVASALAERLLDEDASKGWTVLQPDVMTSNGGAILSAQSDSSILVHGRSPDVDSYRIEATTGVGGITRVRLEAIPDPRLPQSGPGRFPENGNFVLRGFRVSEIPEPGVSRLAPLTHVLYATPPGWSLEKSGRIGAGRFPVYSAWPQKRQPHVAIFLADRPIGHAFGRRLRFEVECGASDYPHQTLGRFRISVTDRPIPRSGPILFRIAADARRSGLMRLGAAYGLLGDWASTAAVLGRAVARRAASDLDALLLALAHHHLGDPETARRDFERVLKRPKTHQADAETQSLTVEALAILRGMDAGAAESLRLDAVFPANPFAR